MALSLRLLIGGLLPALVCGEFHAGIRSTAARLVWSKQLPAKIKLARWGRKYASAQPSGIAARCAGAAPLATLTRGA
ncbi:hypothetical protein FXB40_47465 [Bradyrhizobium rifense]|uniref:Uncharacterized protein n=1 Tax=Bradyrhizobium rifense TaxID=515499 RepID=A0A5D3JRY8_9BRAD|nr:hypothetical protein FXB40_47465 [Bradyrhizobium rifense]